MRDHEVVTLHQHPLRVRALDRVLGVVVSHLDNTAVIARRGSPGPGQPTATSGKGPYFVPGTPVRRDVREDREGVPLDLDLCVVDTAGRPLAGATVEIWHADAHGSYSGYASYPADVPPDMLLMAVRRFRPTDDHRSLRGTQVLDGDGRGGFTTIVPGWYTPRAVHVHLRVTRAGQHVATTEVYLPDEIVAAVHATPAYASRGPSPRNTRNDLEVAMGRGAPGCWLDVEGNVERGLSASATLVVRPPRSGRVRTG